MPESAVTPGLPDGVVPVGDVTNYFTRIGVAAVKLLPDGELELGDEILFFRKDTDDWDTLKVTSLHKDRQPISNANGGDHIGVLIGVPIGRNTAIYRMPRE